MVESTEIKITVDEMSANYKETVLEIIKTFSQTGRLEKAAEI